MQIRNKIISILLVFLLLCSSFIIIPVFAANKASQYVIWDDNPELISANSDYTVNADVPITADENLFDTAKGKNEDIGCFNTLFETIKKGGSSQFAAILSPFNKSSIGFGWMNKSALLQKISPYLHISFDYLIASTQDLPDDTKLTVCIGNASNSKLSKLATVNVSDNGKWENCSNELISEVINSNWGEGYISYYLSSENNDFSGTQTVKIKNLKLTLFEKDRLDINSLLSSVSGIQSISNFSSGVSKTKDKEGNIDYFKLLVNYDKKSAFSANLGNSVYKISVENTDHCDISLSQAVANGTGDVYSSDTVAVQIKLEDRYKVVAVFARDKDGNVIKADTSVRNEKYTFTMPASDVTVFADVKYEQKRDAVLLWYCNPANESVNPWYTGTTRSYDFTGVSGDENQSIYEFTLNKDFNAGSIIVYGNKNNNVTTSLYLDDAEFVVNMKLQTKSADKSVYIGAYGSSKKYKAALGEGFTKVRIPLKAIADDVFSSYLIYTDGLSEGDVITVSDACLWSCPTNELSEYEMFQKMFDLSGYTKSEKNTLIATVGNPDAVVNPYNVVRPPLLAYELAWYTDPFQNASPWFVYANENYEKGNKYGLAFYLETYSDGIQSFDISQFVDTGYLEFYIKTEKDGTTIPFTVCSIGSKTVAPFTVKYDSSKARPDGYMQVRIPFTYFEDMGLNLSAISVVEIVGAQDFTESIFLSSFRFYTNLADVPDPPPLEKDEEQLNERDMPIELNTNVLNAYLDKGKSEVLIPKGTKVWELLAALDFDTSETTVNLFDKGAGSYDDDTNLTEDMYMKVYRRGFLLGQFQFYYLTEDDLSVIPADIAEKFKLSPRIKSDDLIDAYYDDQYFDDEYDYEDDIEEDGYEESAKPRKVIKKIIRKKKPISEEDDTNIYLYIILAIVVAVITSLIIFRKKIYKIFKPKTGGNL